MKATERKYIDKATLETMQARQKVLTEMSMKWAKGKTQEHKSTETTTKGKTTETESTFSNLIRNYENTVIITPKTKKEYTETLTNLAKAIVYSVLKKCIETSQNPQLIRVKQSIRKDLELLDNIVTDNNTAYALEYDTNGNLKQTVIDKDLHKALEKLEQTALNDGIDLVQDAIIAIITETENAKERDGKLIVHFMENPYKVRRLKRKVYIKVEDSVKGWETVETTPIQEVYKAVRRSIESSRAVKVDAKNGYSYIEDIATDTETDTGTVIYKRLPKYIDLGCTVVDYNGKETAYTVDEQTVTDTETIIASLNLSKQQAKILQLRLSGYGYKAIGTYLGIAESNVQTQVKRIQEKCIKIGFTINK